MCSWRATQAKTVAIASAISPPSALVPGPWRITDLGAAGAKVEMHKKCNRAFTDNPIVGFYLADRDKDMYQTIEEVREVRRAATFKEFELLIDIGSQFAQQRDPGARHGLEGVKRLIEEANGPNDYVFAHSMKSFPEAFNAASRGSSAKAVALKGPSAAWGMLADGALTSGASLQGAMHVILPNGSCSPTALQENPQLIVSGIVFISREAFLLAGQLAVGVSHPGAGQVGDPHVQRVSGSGEYLLVACSLAASASFTWSRLPPLPFRSTILTDSPPSLHLATVCSLAAGARRAFPRSRI